MVEGVKTFFLKINGLSFAVKMSNGSVSQRKCRYFKKLFCPFPTFSKNVVGKCANRKNIEYREVPLYGSYANVCKTFKYNNRFFLYDMGKNCKTAVAGTSNMGAISIP